jgi:hypothetical protein
VTYRVAEKIISAVAKMELPAIVFPKEFNKALKVAAEVLDEKAREMETAKEVNVRKVM